MDKAAATPQRDMTSLRVFSMPTFGGFWGQRTYLKVEGWCRGYYVYGCLRVDTSRDFGFVVYRKFEGTSLKLGNL
jgi:hypothetical protein